MFSLIITIVSIALVVALVAATMYHGGDTLTQGRTTADAASFVSGAQQIGGAAVMYLSLEGAAPTSVADLITKKYVASAPVVKGTALALTPSPDGIKPNLVTSTVTSVDVCAQINKTAGVDATKLTSATEADFANLPYGCVATGTVFEFKY